ncbi:hypothetical protein [Oscillatoria sp. FACHB-1406]|uniref:hypothetical protein n=1 Tax=Oscillatoria sp. FACHB-1406 TaxID=2692846 RepID=UPI001689D5E1|nr:hypothetical protein [Oscillatoria sp. FACHB-1406]MBD2580521.1 hypothetical protein [Oscillatoria sp. FACHB-1406]
MYNFFNAIGDFCQETRQVSSSRLNLAQRLGSLVLLATASVAMTSTACVEAAKAQSSLADGTYLYGQSPTPEKIGSEYLVFQVRNGTVTGALYMPSSEFACFTGSSDSRNLNLSVVAPYENETYSHQIALEPQSPVASNGETAVAMGLEGYHRLDAPSENDLRILNSCRAQ